MNLLLDLGARADVSDRCGMTALHYFQYLSVNVIQRLVDEGADLSAKGGYFKGSPLHHFYWPRVPVDKWQGKVEVMLECGADASLCSGNGWSILRYCHGDDVDLLVQYGADVNARDSRGAYPIVSHLSWGQPIPPVLLTEEVVSCVYHIYYANQKTCPLNQAIRKGAVAVVEQLLEAGANVNPATNVPPLVEAICYGDDELISRLLNAGAEVPPEDKAVVFRRSFGLSFPRVRFLPEHEDRLRELRKRHTGRRSKRAM